MDRIQDDSHFKTTYICSSIVFQMLFCAVQQSQSSSFYRREIEKCEEYLRNIEEEITYNWQTPKKSSQLQNFQDVEFFKSDLCLKNKLNIIQEINNVKQQKKSSFMQRNSFNRSSIKSRHSSMSNSAIRQFRESVIKNQQDSTSKFCRMQRKQSLQKLANQKKLSLASNTEKALRQLKENLKKPVENETRNKHRRVIFKKRQKLQLIDQDKLPILVEMDYKITEKTEKGKPTKNTQIPKKKKDNFDLGSISNSKVSIKTSKLKIQEYRPNMNQVTISNWRKFGDLVGTEKPDNLVEEFQQFKNIHYFTQ